LKKNIKQPIEFSIIIPVFNEEGNITPLIFELEQLMREQNSCEVIVVDDHSSDRTLNILQNHQTSYPWLRVIQLNRQSGQSTALRYGIQKAKAPLIVTLDGDGQNDPADIKQLVDTYRKLSRQYPCCLVNGHRIRRRDSPWRRVSSFVANSIRSRLLRDNTPDSGCGIKAFPREIYLDLPSFDHMHRFIPALFRQRGGKIISVEVHHRPRIVGKSHYGTLDRLFAGIIDIFGVLWLGKRAIQPGLVEEEDDDE